MTLVSERRGIDERKGEGVHLVFPNHYIHVFNTFYTEPDKKINDILKTIFVAFSLSNVHEDEYIETNCRSNVISI